MEGGGGFDHKLPQLGVEHHLGPPPFLAVVQAAAADGDAQHLLQAQRLGTDLHFIGPVGFRFAALVLHRHHAPRGFHI